MRRTIFGVLVLAGVATSASGEVVSERMFEYDGTAISHLADEPDGYRDNDGLYYFANWNPANTPENAKLVRPGLQIAFWGKPANCDNSIHNGPVDSGDFELFKRAGVLTGIDAEMKQSRNRWTPSDAHSQCKRGPTVRRGDSFVHVREGKGGGIGMFTATGPGAGHGAQSFLLARDESGQDARGVDKHNVGTFTAFRFNWRDDNAVRPWSVSRAGAGAALEIRSVQTVAQLEMPGDARPAGDVVQAKQEMSFGFINVPCMAADHLKGACQLKMLFNVAIARAGVADWKKEQWFFDGKVLIDRAQGGLPVVIGPIPGRGETVYTKDRHKLPLWSGHASATQFAPFNDEEFRIFVTFDQFKNALRFIAAKTSGKPLDRVTDQDVAQGFGAQWADPGSWRLFWTGFGQEVHNPLVDKRAAIGGAMKYLRVSARE